MTALPEAPAPKHRGAWSRLSPAGRLIVFGVGIAVALVLVSTSSSDPGSSEPLTNTVNTACLDTDTGSAAAYAASDEMSAAGSAVTAGDMDAVLLHLANAQADFQRAALATQADPAISGPLYSAAGLIGQARSAFSSGDYAAAGDYADQANAYVTQATNAIYATTVPTC